MIADEDQRASAAAGPVRVDVTPARLPAAAGEPAMLLVEVTNTDEVIREIGVELLGVDHDWATVSPDVLTLFPDERGTFAVTLVLPHDYPAGRRPVSLAVGDASLPGATAVVTVELDVATVPRVEVRVEPVTVTGGRAASVMTRVTNKGNGALDLELVGIDAEGQLDVAFQPPRFVLASGGEAMVRAELRARRPILGTPTVRPFSIEARGHQPPTEQGATPDAAHDAGPDAGPDGANPDPRDAGREPITVDQTVATFVQRPWLSRKIISMFGLLGAVTVLGLVFTASFGSVAAETKANEALLKKNLAGADAAAGGQFAAGTALAGQVLSATGVGIDGVVVYLFAPDNGVTPVYNGVTAPDGRFRFSGIAGGSYKLKVSAAGFGDRWYPAAVSIEQSDELKVEAGKSLDGITMALTGLPASLGGTVLGDDVKDAVVTVRVPAAAVQASTATLAPAIVKTLTADASGLFAFADLPTPATYEVVASKPGLESEVRSVHLDPGAAVTGLTLLLHQGVGVIAGQVVDRAGVGVGNVKVAITDGSNNRSTLTLSGAAPDAGRFELRNLQTPATYSLTFSADGWFSQSQTLHLDTDQIASGIQVVLVPSIGAMGGTVTDSAGKPLGGVTVSVVGPGTTRIGASLTNGFVGAWQIQDLAIPGTYTVSFSAPGFAGQTIAVDITMDNAIRTDVNAVLTGATASVSGTVRELGHPTDEPGCNPNDDVLDDCRYRLGQVIVTMASATLNRHTVTADSPTGAFRFDGIVPGAYTITLSRVGSSSQTVFVELAAGEARTLPDIFLEPQARITGRITTNGIATANIGVRVYRLADYPNLPVAVTATDNLGNFSIIGLDAPETYVIEYQVPAGGAVRTSKQVFLQPGAQGDGSLAL